MHSANASIYSDRQYHHCIITREALKVGLLARSTLIALAKRSGLGQIQIQICIALHWI
jgi:hypothetical protein